MQKFSLRESKGAVLPVLLLMITEKRPVSIRYMVTETDYCEKTVTKALDFLQKKQAVVQVGRLFQFCGDDYQLPLYWGEQIEPANPSPALGQATLPGMDCQDENFSGKNFGFEILPPAEKISGNAEKFSESEKFSELEKRVTAIEAEIISLKAEKNSETENFSIETREKFSEPEKNLPENFSLINNLNKELNNDPDMDESCLILSEKNSDFEIPEEISEKWEQLTGIRVNRSQFDGLLDHAELLKFENNTLTICVSDQWYFGVFERQNIFDRLKYSFEGYELAFTVMTAEDREMIQARKDEQRRKAHEEYEKEMAVEQQRRKEEYESAHLSIPENPEYRYEKENVGICNRYIDNNPGGINYSLDELRSLVKMNPFPLVLDFVLPRAASIDAAKQWVRMSMIQLKAALMSQYCHVKDPKFSAFVRNEYITPHLIDYHYWKWYLEDRIENPHHTAGWYVYQIETGAEKMVAENDGPIQCAYLEVFEVRHED